MRSLAPSTRCLLLALQRLWCQCDRSHAVHAAIVSSMEMRVLVPDLVARSCSKHCLRSRVEGELMTLVGAT